jgi:2-methylcitrate dehydratase PrpD
VREATTATADPSITEDQSAIEVQLTDGRVLTRFVEASLGNLRRPLSDPQLEAKCREQALLVLPPDDAERLIELCWKVEELSDASELVRATVPRSAPAEGRA